ncbi:CRISPR-associated protein, Csm3 family [Rubellimicrobium thermophilum DSM 16684]|uniref:CRISPR system Cms endoribonuclease Csm3 n=1 Tax=Rubellimicrobium thermophilum DSM 16684 TaxID=1123069 RepID=S9S279_9RHOB|nr:type III-A CRISPR-associated RAMP protein Csm3 [Rubellimicrobium thermophilum]EPX84340.1 CRISPR-associated protein, Csm3 family [Rubellimicrobium thermophilum DSM 16684]
MAETMERTVDAFLGLARLSGTIRVITGLHIGAGKDAVEIGGIDAPVVKTPAGDPYIPGSSIKGRMRFLMEWAFGTVRHDGHAWGWKEEDCRDAADPVLRIFGTNAKREAWGGGPTRLLVRDAHLKPDWRQAQLEAGRELTEVKTEVVIDRIAGKALDNVGPRQFERVPPGAEFGFDAVFRLYSVAGDGGRRDRECLAWAIQGLGLIEQDALGGHGSRGYGRVSFGSLTLEGPAGTVTIGDNTRTAARFDKARPDEEILKAVRQACGGE